MAQAPNEVKEPADGEDRVMLHFADDAREGFVQESKRMAFQHAEERCLNEDVHVHQPSHERN
eukprot:1861121-Pleurochrysis_carterae.AAC.1